MDKKSGGPRFWDILLVRGDGHWLGFRSPFESLQRAATYFVLILALGLVSTTGWILSRWQVERLSRALSRERLRGSSLEAKLSDSQKSAISGTGLEQKNEQISLMPSLDGAEFKSPTIDLGNAEFQFDTLSQDLSVSFDILRHENSPAPASFYWVVLLHGSRGVIVLPSALTSRSGEVVQFHRGQIVEAVKAKRTVSARFKIRDFVESSGSDPVYGTVLVYDSKGSLMTRKRSELAMRKRGPEPRGTPANMIPRSGGEEGSL
jgi:hypothetical protein